MGIGCGFHISTDLAGLHKLTSKACVFTGIGCCRCCCLSFFLLQLLLLLIIWSFDWQSLLAGQRPGFSASTEQVARCSVHTVFHLLERIARLCCLLCAATA